MAVFDALKGIIQRLANLSFRVIQYVRNRNCAFIGQNQFKPRWQVLVGSLFQLLPQNVNWYASLVVFRPNNGFDDRLRFGGTGILGLPNDTLKLHLLGGG